MKILPEDWSSVIIPEFAIVELVVRGIILYFFILFILRVLPRRATGELSAMDLVFILLLTEMASHSLGDYSTLGDGLIMMCVIIVCHQLVSLLSYHSQLFRKLFDHSEILIVANGKLILKNMRKEHFSIDELMANLRQSNIEKIADIKKAYIEGDGKISFILYNDKDKQTTKKKDKDLDF